MENKYVHKYSLCVYMERGAEREKGRDRERMRRWLIPGSSDILCGFSVNIPTVMSLVIFTK